MTSPACRGWRYYSPHEARLPNCSAPRSAQTFLIRTTSAQRNPSSQDRPSCRLRSLARLEHEISGQERRQSDLLLQHHATYAGLGGAQLRGQSVETVAISQQHLAVQFDESLHQRTIAEVEKLVPP